MAIKDGGAAFPMMNTQYTDASEGMSLRDYFAGQALHGLCTHEWILTRWPNHTVAECAYQLADAMLVQRQQTDGDQ